MAAQVILIVEDDDRIGSTLLRAMCGSGYDARWERTGRGGLVAAGATRPDLVLLDLGLPDVDGLEVCREIHRQDPTVDILMLTARDEELDVVVGLDAGAVDYVTKPFKLAELLARIRAQLRRAEPRACGRTITGDLTIDTGARRAWVDGSEVRLRAKEFDLLARLVADAGSAVSRESLMSDVGMSTGSGRPRRWISTLPRSAARSTEESLAAGSRRYAVSVTALRSHEAPCLSGDLVGGGDRCRAVRCAARGGRGTVR